MVSPFYKLYSFDLGNLKKKIYCALVNFYDVSQDSYNLNAVNKLVITKVGHI